MTSCVSSRKQSPTKGMSGKTLADVPTGACTAACTDSSETAHVSPDLAEVIDAWPKLPEAIRAAILTMVQASVQPHGERTAREPKE